MSDTAAAMAVLDSGAGPVLAGSAVLLGDGLGRLLPEVMAAMVDVDSVETVGKELVVVLVVKASPSSSLVSLVVIVVGLVSGVEVNKNGRLTVVVAMGIESVTGATVGDGNGAALCATGRGDTACADGTMLRVGTAAGRVEVRGAAGAGAGPSSSVFTPPSSVSSTRSRSRLNSGRSVA